MYAMAQFYGISAIARHKCLFLQNFRADQLILQFARHVSKGIFEKRNNHRE